MKTSEKGRKFIEMWEGLYLHTYDDGTGTLTIGYGHTSAAGPPHVYRGMKITEEQADAILASDLAAVELNVSHHLSVPVTQDQFDALVSFDFNTGGFARSSLMRDINGKHPDRIEHDFLMWVRGGGHVMQGLVRRRKAEIELFEHGTLKGP